ncbi:two-component system sensor kinase [Amycolatopsis sp. K13G38]|uniref:Two-component system sensor kinase n=1 Tax=Amycolatopsis acididurans TaxID=2724524 RepID=A0ABX1JCY8_9PSEU|nr:sensor domain-containing protein [Amycolatopsis acididurans]NKQ57618.1 two-component system sensor kinase [Amycolatopsis acididurans]
MTSAYSDGSDPHPPVGGSLVFLLLSLPVGIAGFVSVVTLATLGLATVIVWAGLPVLALLILGARVAARLERVRVHGLLSVYVATPYRPIPAAGLRARWRARLADAATWRDLAYFVLLFPIGIAEFVVVVTLWSAGIGLAALPVYFQSLPPDAHVFGYFSPGTFVETLPWAALGVLVIAVSIAATRSMGILHARYARAVLGPGRRARLLAEKHDPTPLSTVA